MQDLQLPLNNSTASDPCNCGSGLPRVLCCLARRTLSELGRPMSLSSREEQDAVVAQWDLALSTVQALTAVLPYVPVPLLGNRTPQELYPAGPEERAAALSYLDAVGRTADAIGLDFPAARIAEVMASPKPPQPSPEQRQQIALASFTLQMLARGFEPGAVLGGQRLFRDALRIVRPTFRKPAVFAGAVDYAMCWMHFRPEAGRQVAELYGVSASAIMRSFSAMKRELKLVWYDPRYAVQEPAWQHMLQRTARALAEGEEEPTPPGQE
jgi:hypothetical protein